MKQTLLAILALAVCLVAPTLMKADTNANVGTWKINLDKSTYPAGMAPKSLTRTITADGDNVTYSFDGTAADGSALKYSFTVKYDGKDYPITGTGPLAGFVGTDSYTATKSELLFLANAYADLGTWWCVTPFVGAGIGTARVSVGNFTDTGDFINTGLQTHSFNSAGQGSQWNFAWALHAGLAYKVSPGLTLELAYSYVNLGNGITGPTSSFDQVTNTTHAPFSYNNITSNDVKLGLRWELNTPPAYSPPPLVTKG